MSISSFLRQTQEKVFNCIETNLQTNIDVRNVNISYLGDYSFHKAIKRNYPQATEILINLYREYDQGIYKHIEHIVLIKRAEMFNASVLLVELLHSRAIFQGKKYVQDWINEGIPHYLAYELCRICGIDYQVSLSEKDHLIFWNRIHKRYYQYGLPLFELILYPITIDQSIEMLSRILRYSKYNILELEFEEAQKHISALGY